MPPLCQPIQRLQSFNRSENETLFASLAEKDRFLLHLNSEELQEVIVLGFNKAFEVISQRRAEYESRGIKILQDKGTGLWNTRYADAVRVIIPKLVLHESPADRRLRCWERSVEGKIWAAKEADEKYNHARPSTIILSSSGPSTISQNQAAHTVKFHQHNTSLASVYNDEEVLDMQGTRQDVKVDSLPSASSSPNHHGHLDVESINPIHANEPLVHPTDEFGGRVVYTSSHTPSELSHRFQSPTVLNRNSRSVSPVVNPTTQMHRRERTAELEQSDAETYRSEISTNLQQFSRLHIAQHNLEEAALSSFSSAISHSDHESDQDDKDIIHVARPMKSSKRAARSARKSNSGSHEVDDSEEEELAKSKDIRSSKWRARSTSESRNGGRLRIQVMCGTRGCARGFSTQERMNRHVRKDHDGEQDYICDICDETFSKSFQLRRHMRQEHQN